MNKDQKKNYIEKMTTDIDKSQAVIVTHYQGLNMPQLDQLRKQRCDEDPVFKQVPTYTSYEELTVESDKYW